MTGRPPGPAEAAAARALARSTGNSTCSSSVVSRATARSIVFSSWRTLPGQSYPHSASSDSAMQAAHAASGGGVVFLEKVVGQQRNVFRALAQRAARGWESRSAGSKDLRETGFGLTAFRDRGWWRRSRAHRWQISLVPPTGRTRALLQHAQQLHLHGERHLADLVEEDRASIRPLRRGRACSGSLR